MEKTWMTKQIKKSLNDTVHIGSILNFSNKLWVVFYIRKIEVHNNGVCTYTLLIQNSPFDGKSNLPDNTYIFPETPINKSHDISVGQVINGSGEPFIVKDVELYSVNVFNYKLKVYIEKINLLNTTQFNKFSLNNQKEMLGWSVI